jgi:5'(3')-deoxyribonucleotidase
MPNEEKTAEPIGLFDLDGTMADFDKSMAHHLELLRSPGEDPAKDETAFEDIPHMKARRRLIKQLPGFWRTFSRLQAGFDILALMEDLKFSNYVLSKSPRKFPLAASEKIGWCVEHLPNLPVILSEEKSLVYGKVLVDDWPSYVEKWVKFRPRGLVISVAQRWNEGIEKLSPAGNIIRYSGPEQLPDIKARLVEIRSKCRD